MNAAYSPYASTPAADYYYDKKDYVSPSPTPSPRGPTYYYGGQPQRPATRAHFRHMSSGGMGGGHAADRGVGAGGVFHEYAANTSSSRPPTFSPRYTSDGHYATANVSSSRSAQKQSATTTTWASSPRTPRRERRSASFSYYRASDSIGDSDEDELVKIDGVTYVLPARSRSRKQPHQQQRSQSYYIRSSGDRPKKQYHRGDKHYRDDDYYHNYYDDVVYGTNHIHHFEQGGYGFVEKDIGRGFESPRFADATEARRATPTGSAGGHGHTRRASTSMPMPARPQTARPVSSHYHPPPANTSSARKSSAAAPPSSPPPRRATEADAKRCHIPAGYSLKNWDPTEDPIMLLGSVFDANSLGKWIYDWTTYHHGSTSPISEVAGELWLLLIQLAGKIRRTDEVMPRVRTKENKEMLEDFIISGERLTDKLRKLLKTCEAPMLRTTGKRDKTQLGKNAGIEFVETLFGHDREMDKTERFMQSVRLWNLRFDANCEDILRKPTQ
ncbi:hypothetical protein SPBR_04231 [Sporothrix brasiliensis 5110]|uniref:Vegetative cell wall protein gp1 n=1 Tax=Sporothrix brasiliensis 5110 TaxID=1398154 RepID=A0A0C2J3H1_9PEZI|nr:uncharacterized protein SPBR_04231 [Sporothrix brasiliensis 5110]KIH93570.1 hypothetical protein SPBR_04231 [Sporothrix brasiliensis 5110]